MADVLSSLFDALTLPEPMRSSVLPYAVMRQLRLVEVLSVWKSAVDTQAEHPEASGKLAEWAVSVAALCGELDSEPVLRSILDAFGELEQYPTVERWPANAANAQWNELRMRLL
jgi:hypothetical protein